MVDEYIKLRFTGGWGLASPLVAWKTKSKWTHVDLYVETGYLSSMPFKGVRIFDWNYIKPKVEKTIYVKVKDKQEFMDLARSQLGKKYDWSAWLYHITGWFWPRKNRWTCAGLLATILQIGDKMTTSAELWLMLVGPEHD